MTGNVYVIRNSRIIATRLERPVKDIEAMDIEE